MRELRPWVLLGQGRVGSAVLERSQVPGEAIARGIEEEPVVIATRRRGLLNADETHSTITDLRQLSGFKGVVFNTLPSTEDGELSLELMEFFLEQGATVVTAEKTAWARNRELILAKSDDGARFGDTATVGGGSRLLRVAETIFDPIHAVSEAHAVLNGSWAAISDMVSPGSGSGISLGRAVVAARAQGILEPLQEGERDDPIGSVLGERGDIPKKVKIFTDTVFKKLIASSGDTPLSVDEMVFALTPDDVERVMHSEASDYRAITSLYSLDYHEPIDPKASGIIGGFSVIRYNWQIVSGFQQFRRHRLMRALGQLTGPNNGLYVGIGPSDRYGDPFFSGPGAGPDVTADALYFDSDRLRK